MNEQKITGVIDSLRRIRNTSHANPRYKLTLQSGAILRTAPESQVGYVINNSENLGVEVELTLRNDMVVKCEPVKK